MKELKCWYDSRQQHYLKLMPIKVEQNSIEPVIYTFHDVLSDEEIETIKQLAKPLVRFHGTMIKADFFNDSFDLF